METMFWKIMFFYALLSCFIGPAVGYLLMRSNKGLEIGYFVGTAISILLWFKKGRTMI